MAAPRPSWPSSSSRQVLTELCLTGERISGERLARAGPCQPLGRAGRGPGAGAGAGRSRWPLAPMLAMARIKDAVPPGLRATRWTASWSWKPSYMVQSQETEESREGIGAFLEKRAPILHACARASDAPRDGKKTQPVSPADMTTQHCLKTWTFRWKACACSICRACLPARLCGQVLADFGAEVIKVEHPGRGDDTRDWGMRIGKTETTYYNSMNRNKRSITLDLQSARRRADHLRPAAAVRRGDPQLQARRRRQAGPGLRASSRPSSPT